MIKLEFDHNIRENQKGEIIIIARGKRSEMKIYDDAMTQQEKDKIVEYLDKLNPKFLLGDSIWNGLKLYQKLYINILWKTRNLNPLYFKRR